MPRGCLAVAWLCVACGVGCAMTPERLPDLQRRFYNNLPSPTERSAFLALDDQGRQRFLEQQGMWGQWVELPRVQREAASRGEIELGFDEFALYIAWGPPADTQERNVGNRTAIVYTYIRCSSGPHRGEYVHNNLACDGTSQEARVALQEGTIVEIKYED